jgi:4-hydroxy-tetrahydrodipicolinate reductase
LAEVGSEAIAWSCGRDQLPPALAVDVVIDASVGAAVESHLEWALASDTPLVIAATGFSLPDLAERVGRKQGVLVAANGSLTVALLERLVRLLGAYASANQGSGYLIDHHHGAKRDAPSGTARRLAAAWSAGAGREPALVSVRAGFELGRHVVGLDLPFEKLEIDHQVRSRAVFAAGLLQAAQFVVGRRGLFTMADVAADRLDSLFTRFLTTSGARNS